MTTATLTLPTTGHYAISPAGSKITFTAKHMFSLGTVEGSFAVSGGTITVAEPPTASIVSAAAPSSSFSSGNLKRDGHVTGEKFLNAAVHPEITFTSNEFKPEGASWILRGTLTANGVSAPLDLTVDSITPSADGFAIAASGTADRYAHGMTQSKGMAGRHLKLTVTAVATQV